VKTQCAEFVFLQAIEPNVTLYSSTGERLGQVDGLGDYGITSIALSSHGQLLAAAVDEPVPTLLVWSWKTVSRAHCSHMQGFLEGHAARQ
jgi:hypothetical protein